MDQSASTPPEPKVAAVIANIAQLMDEAEQMLRDSTSQHAEAQSALLCPPGDNLPAHLAVSCEHAGRALAAGAQRTDRTLRAHPYLSLAAVLGAGVWCGMVLARRKA